MAEAVAARGIPDETISLAGSLSAEHGEREHRAAAGDGPATDRHHRRRQPGPRRLRPRPASGTAIRIPDDISLVTCDEVDLSELHDAADRVRRARHAAAGADGRRAAARAAGRRRPADGPAADDVHRPARAAARSRPADRRRAARHARRRARRRRASVTFAEPLPACDSRPRTSAGCRGPRVRVPPYRSRECQTSSTGPSADRWSSGATPVRLRGRGLGGRPHVMPPDRAAAASASSRSARVPSGSRRGPSPRPTWPAASGSPARPTSRTTTGDVEFAIIRRRMRILGPSDVPITGLDPVVTADDIAVRYAGQPIDLRRAHVLGLAIDIGTTTVVFQLIDLLTGRPIGGAALENPQRFGGSDVMTRISYEQDFPGAMRARAAPRPEPRAARPVPRARHRPARGLRGDDRRQQHDARPVLRHRHRADRRVPVQVDHRAGDAATASEPTTWLRRRGHEVGLLMNPHGRVVGAPLIASHVGARHRRRPRRGRFRGGQRHPDARRHRDEHRGRGHRRHALPRRVVPGRAGLRGRPDPLRHARRRRGHRDRCSLEGDEFAFETIGATEPAGDLRLRPRRHPGRAPAPRLDEHGGSLPRRPRRVDRRARAGHHASRARTPACSPRPRRPTPAASASCCAASA